MDFKPFLAFIKAQIVQEVEAKFTELMNAAANESTSSTSSSSSSLVSTTTDSNSQAEPEAAVHQ